MIYPPLDLYLSLHLDHFLNMISTKYFFLLLKRGLHFFFFFVVTVSSFESSCDFWCVLGVLVIPGLVDGN